MTPSDPRGGFARRAGRIEPFDLDGPSFSALLRRDAPEALAAAFAGPAGGFAGPPTHLEGTTIVALVYGDSGVSASGEEQPAGVVIAGDRRAPAGNVISKRDMRKVFESDSWSAVWISGASGPAM